MDQKKNLYPPHPHTHAGTNKKLTSYTSEYPHPNKSKYQKGRPWINEAGIDEWIEEARTRYSGVPRSGRKVTRQGDEREARTRFSGVPRSGREVTRQGDERGGEDKVQRGPTLGAQSHQAGRRKGGEDKVQRGPTLGGLIYARLVSA